MKNLKRITAVFLAMVLTMTNFMGIGAYLIGGLETYATETTTVAELGMNKSQLSNSVENDVSFTITLHTEEETHDLYKNPSFIIELPKHITVVEIENPEVLNINEEYTISPITISESSGHKQLVFSMEWEQLSRATSLSSNVQINIDAVLKTEDFIPTLQETAKLTYTNIDGQKSGTDEVAVELVSETGILLATTVNADGEQARSYKSDIGTLMVHKKAVDPISTEVDVQLINNIGATLEDVKVLGLVDNIEEIDAISGCQIYYSENENPNVDLTDLTNGWGSYTALSKAFLLVIDEIDNLEEIDFSYNTVLNDAKDYEIVHDVYVDNMQLTEALSNLRVIRSVAQLSEITSRIETYIMKNFFDLDYVEVGSKVTYNLYLKNTSTDTKTVEVLFGVPTGAKCDKAKVCKEQIVTFEDEEYVTYLPIDEVLLTKDPQQSVTITIEPNEELLLKLPAEVENYVNNTMETNFVVIDGNDEQTITDTRIVKAPANISANIEIYDGEEKVQEAGTVRLDKGDELTYIITLTNDGELSDTVDVEYTLPANMSITKIQFLNENDEVIGEETEYYGNALNAECEVPGNSHMKIIITAENTESLESTIEVENAELVVTSDVTDITEQSVGYSIMAKAKGFTTTQEEPTDEGPIDEGPTEDPTENETGENSDTEKLSEEPTKDDPTQGQLGNEEQKPDEQPSSNPQEGQEKYSISGLAWLDQDYDGAREDGEPFLKGIKVNLYTIDSDVIVKYTLTDESGKYKFSELEQGEYIVSFEYDPSLYDITKTDSTIAEDINSDAVVTTQGSVTMVKTNKITVDHNVTCIDIGLVLKDAFDLKIDKYIKQVTVQNEEGTTTTAMPDKNNFAKIEIPSKVFKGSMVVITYNIVITNTGKVAAQVSSILDEKPESLVFSSEVNKDWYETDGKLYNISLANETINPGESKTVELVLTKEITEDSKVTIKNTAKIQESFNEQLLKEKDLDNNTSSAELLITVRTGGEVVYIGLVISCLMIVSIGIYMINKKVLN